MTTKQQVVAYFDFDGTLSNRDTFLPFLLKVVGVWHFILQSPWLLIIGLTYLLKIIDNEQAKSRILQRLICGLSKKQLEHYAEQFASLHLSKYIKPEIFARLEWHREHGHTLYLVSANLAIYLRYWVQLHNLDGVIATELEFDQHQCATGNLATANCFGAEKVRRIQAYLQIQQLNFDYIYAYGNSRGDYEMLEYANEGFYVSGDKFEPWPIK
ncbi:MAG: hypothetical protein RLZZ293_782 [Pseudomonadota bacterium]|jgi:HAD superfamily hydrolase (TIGR01490 family)